MPPKLAEYCRIFNRFLFDSLWTRPYHCAPMSDAPIPRYADLRKLATAEGRISGVLALADLPRLNELLASRDGEATVDLHCGLDDEGLRIIAGTIRAVPQLRCQRCLDTMSCKLEIEVRIAMCWHEDEVASLQSRIDALVIGSEPSDLYELVEEELLLALPMVPKHEQGECHAGDYVHGEDEAAGEAVSAANPFAVLVELKRG